MERFDNCNKHLRDMTKILKYRAHLTLRLWAEKIGKCFLLHWHIIFP